MHRRSSAMTGQLSDLRLYLRVYLRIVSFTGKCWRAKKMTLAFNSILIEVVKGITRIKAHVLNSCKFEQLCEDINAEQRCLLLYIEIRWLSHVKLLIRVFELRKPLQKFFSENKSLLAAHFSDKKWRVAKLASLCDIFKLLNEFNLFF